MWDNTWHVLRKASVNSHLGARGGMEELRGGVAQLGVRRIEVGRRGLAGATSDGDFARFCSLELDLAQRKENGERNGSFKASTRIRAPTPRSGAIADVWRRRRRAQAPVWPASVTVTSTVETLFTRLNDFSSSLTS